MLGGWRKEKAGFETDSNSTHRQSSLYNVGCVRMRLSIDQGQNEIERTRKAEIRNTELPATDKAHKALTWPTRDVIEETLDSTGFSAERALISAWWYHVVWTSRTILYLQNRMITDRQTPATYADARPGVLTLRQPDSKQLQTWQRQAPSNFSWECRAEKFSGKTTYF